MDWKREQTLRTEDEQAQSEIHVETHSMEEQQQEQMQQEQVQQQTMADRLRIEEAEFWAQHPIPAGAVQNEEVPQAAGTSRKQRRKLAKQREKALREGRKYSNFSDLYTAQLHKEFTAYAENTEARKEALNLAIKAHPQEPAVDVVRRRIAAAYMPDYKMNKRRRPVSKQDAQTAQSAQKQAEDYLYGTTEEKHAVLDNIVKQMISLDFRVEMFTVPYIRSHFREMKRLDEKLMLMSQLDNLHPDYFAALPPETQELWNTTHALANILSVWLGNTGEISGLDTRGIGMRISPLSEAEFMVVWQTMADDIRLAFQSRENAVRAYQRTLGN